MRVPSHKEWKRSVPASIAVILSCCLGVLSSNDPTISDSRVDFTCKTGTIIPVQFVCDGEFDCGPGDRSDESNCVENRGSRGSGEVSEELYESEEILEPRKQEQKIPVEDPTPDDKMHEDVSSIGKSWFEYMRLRAIQ